MTIQANYYACADLGNGTTTVFSLPWPFRAQGDIVVDLLDTNGAQVIPRPVLNGTGTYDYTITGTPDPDTGFYPSGNVVFRTAPPSGYTAFRARATLDQQDKVLPTNGRFPAKSVEGALDRRTLVDQEQDYLLGGGAGTWNNGRVVTMNAFDFSTFHPELPLTQNAGGMILGLTADATQFQFYSFSNGPILSIIGTNAQIVVTPATTQGQVQLSLPSGIYVEANIPYVPGVGPDMAQSWRNSSPTGVSILRVLNDNYNQGGVQIVGSNFTATGDTRFPGSMTMLYGDGPGGVAVGAFAANAPIIFMTNLALSQGEIARFNPNGYFGIGRVPNTAIDVLENQNNVQAIHLSNPNTGTGAYAKIIADNGVHEVSIQMNGTGIAAAGVIQPDGGFIFTSGAGGLTVGTNTVSPSAPLIFMTNGNEVGRFDASGNLGIGHAPGPLYPIDILRNASGLQRISIQNASAAPSAGAFVGVANDTGNSFYMAMWSSGTANGGLSFNANGAVLMTQGTGGLTIGNQTAAAPIWFANNGVGIASFAADGTWACGQGINFTIATGGHAFEYNMNGGCSLNIKHTGSGPTGLNNVFNVTTNNTTAFEYCFEGGSWTTLRYKLQTNGGIQNYSANNANLCDATSKSEIEVIDGALGAKLWAAHKAIDWCRYKYADQTHDDWNFGYTAQGIQKAFADVAPSLVDLWPNPIPPGEDKPRHPDRLAVYEHDIFHISGAILSEAQRRIERLEAIIASLTKEKPN